MDGTVRLDLGAGDKKQEGWISVDVRNDGGRVQPDIQADITKRLPFPDDYADEIRAIHVIEHFQVWDAPNIVREWVRVLRPGGAMAIECPDFDKILALANVPNVPPSFTFWAIYGDPRHHSPEMMHKWCYSRRHLSQVMEKAGLEGIGIEPCRFHHPIRDMRLVGFKPKSAIVAP